MLYGDFKETSTKRRYATEPLVDNHGKRILIASRLWIALQLFRREVERRSGNLLIHNKSAVRVARVRRYCQPKVSEQEVILETYKHVLRLDIAVYQMLAMSVLQGRGNLLNIGDDEVDGQARTNGVMIAQGATRGIVHYQKRRTRLYRKIKQAHNMRMTEVYQPLGFLYKGRLLLIVKYRV